ncbi:X-Serrate-1 protein [Aphelenchoides avenae]|nr:X-Serrate-1 protein [Aphelenchus avenae]
MIPAVYGGGQVHLTVKEFTLSDHTACETTALCAIELQLCIGTPEAACLFVDRFTRLDNINQLLTAPTLSANFSRGWSEDVVLTVRIRNGSTKRLVLLSRTFVNMPTANDSPKSITTVSNTRWLLLYIIRFRAPRATGSLSKCMRNAMRASLAATAHRTALVLDPGLASFRLCQAVLQNRKELHCFRDNFVCTSNGRECLPGWTGVDCKEPLCEKECRNGKCVAPNTCSCMLGWTGETCADCVTYNGCKNGYCTRPGTCVCRPNWTGRFCDKVVDKCAERPCRNGGICTSVEHNTFVCICPEGFTGETCSDKEPPCAKQPCGPNGVCVNTGWSRDDYVCQCNKGFVGRNCDRVRKVSPGRLRAKMNVTVNDIKITLRASNCSASIEHQLDLLTVLVVLLLVFVVLIGLCIAGQYLKSIKAWSRRDVTPENTDDGGGLEDDAFSGHVHSEKPRADTMIRDIKDNVVDFHRSLYLPSPPPPYDRCIELVDERARF